MSEIVEPPRMAKIRSDGRIGVVVAYRGPYLIIKLIQKEPGYPDEEVYLTFHQDAIELVNESP